MADYLTPTVIQQTIPETDISPLELLLFQFVNARPRSYRLGHQEPRL